MRIVLISTVVLLGAVPLFAQSPQADARVGSPGGMMSRQQAVGPQALPTTRTLPAETEVSPDTPVVTLEGICDQSQVSGTKACKTVITRAQIDSLIDLVTPDASPAARRTFAISYARLLAAAAAAQREHLEKDSAVAAELQAQLNLTRARVLSNHFYHHLEERAANVTPSEIQKYYTDHKENFEEGDVRRLSIPKSALTIRKQPMDASDVKAGMDELVTRAAAGENFDQLEQKAYIMFGITSAPAPIKAIMLRRTALRPEEAKVFDLNVGEVSPLLDLPDAFVILRLESKQFLPIEQVQPEIMTILQQERRTQELQTAAKGVKADFNLAYLGVSLAPELFLSQASAQLSASRATVPEPRPRAPLRRRTPFGAQGPRALPLQQ